MNVNNIKTSNINFGDFQKEVNSSKQNNVSFQDFLKDAVYSVADLEKESDNMTNKFMTGEVDNLHDVMIASQKASIAVQSFTEVKNKVMDAYKEIMRMQV